MLYRGTSQSHQSKRVRRSNASALSGSGALA
ncbi:hypothetical protein CGSMWGv00703C2mash_05931 [Gardnerella pickettii 00703C2mash]|nr:hypothetical protein CGSMWGv00703C2mash_05931 [Gardnerella pickettii 00703C2mash]